MFLAGVGDGSENNKAPRLHGDKPATTWSGCLHDALLANRARRHALDTAAFEINRMGHSRDGFGAAQWSCGNAKRWRTYHDFPRVPHSPSRQPGPRKSQPSTAFRQRACRHTSSLKLAPLNGRPWLNGPESGPDPTGSCGPSRESRVMCMSISKDGNADENPRYTSTTLVFFEP